ncbi:LuxR C-terminal-related transcriptional regulator [Frankia sp. R82]|uniref:helix-turn-helix transcriptional regulator n=1 Tax=Frankia sp. R82 TaxID=2950553 RepID=UPI0020439A8B|nr:LuxR C-terminal-related transcriptional regulator [Frankia sp. R82]MCM3885422.1 LuxR C-terminal-related transcriptional regulator [Frankia sp. R82]
MFEQVPLVHGNFAVPVAPSGFVDRPRLRADLDAAMARPLTVLRAPAGWGKTTLLASWSVGRSGRPPLVWISLDPQTRSAGDRPVAAEGGPGLPLWPQLRHGLRVAGLMAPDALPGEDAPTPAVSAGYRSLANLLATRAEPVVIVLDDVDRVRHPADLDGLDLLLRHAGDRVRLVVAGRSVAMALHRLRADGRVTEFGPRDLAFSEREALDLLRSPSLSASADLSMSAADLVRATEGWPTGLRLATAVIDIRLPPSGLASPEPEPEPDQAQAVLARVPAIADFLRAEVIAGHSPEVRRFLLRTSLLDEVTAPLADAVVAERPLSPGAGILADLAEHDGFVVELTAGQCYRYHRLLAAMLRAELARERVEDVDELNLRAALWFTAHRRPLDAMRHAVRAGDWWYAACLLLDGPGQADQLGLVGALLGRPHVLDSTLAAIPAAPAHCPEWALVAAVGQLRHGQVDRAGGALRTAREAIAVAPASRRRWLGVQADLIDLSRAELCGAAEQMQGLARRLLRPSPLQPPVDVDETVQALAWCGRGRAQLWLGRPDAAVDALVVALEAARAADSPAVAMSAGGALALALALRGRLRLAESHACDVLAHRGGTDQPAAVGNVAGPPRSTVPTGTPTTGAGAVPTTGAGMAPAGVVEAHLALVVVALGRVDRERAAWHLQAARASHGSGHPPGLRDLVTIWQAGLLQRLGHPDDVRAARRLLGGQGRPPGPPLCVSLWQAAEIDLLLATGNAQAARGVLERAGQSGRTDQVLALARARVDLGCADLTAADQTVSALLRTGGGGGPTVTACVLAAVVAARRGDHARATDLLARGLALAEDEGFASPFVDLGGEVTALLNAHPGLSTAHPRFVAELHDLLAREATRRSATRVSSPRGVLPGPGTSGPGTSGPGTPVTATPGAALPGPTLPRASVPTGLPATGPGYRSSGPVVRSTGRPAPRAPHPVLGPRDPSAPGGAPDGRGGGAAIPAPGAQRDATIRVPAPAGPRGPGDPVRPGAPAGPVRSSGPGSPGNSDGVGSSGPPAAPGTWGRGAGPVAGRRSGSPTAGDRLSDRELAVLSYLPTMLTTAEIAAELYVSVNTVKTHLKSIYRKLDVPRRRDAVHRARELHLL